jgi:large subunit ribosomal protein L25
MQEINLDVQKRDAVGKGHNRRLRAAGRIPAVVYGAGRETVTIEVERKALLDNLKKGGGENTIFVLKLGETGKSRHAMIRELQIDPLSRQIVHIDFQRILMDQKVRVQVAIELVGVAYGVKNEAAILDFVTRQVAVECLPADIPPKLPFDVSELHVNQHVEAKDLAIPENVTLLEEPDRVIVSCTHSRVEVEVAAAAPAEGEEGALLETEPAEPEVIKRGKAVDEEAAEGESEKGKEKGGREKK